MAKVVTIAAAFLGIVSLILVAIAMATNYWVRMDDRVPGADPSPLNPLLVNSELTNLVVNYDLDYFGLWVGCYKERDFGSEVSCGYIGSSCYAEICWIRNGADTTCLDRRATPVQNCSAYQATRAMTIIGTLFLIFGASLLLVSICVSSRSLSTSGAVCTFVAGFFLMIAFAVFYKNVFKDGPLDPLGRIGWSFKLLIAAWPIAILASLLGCLSSLGKAREQEDFDQSE